MLRLHKALWLPWPVRCHCTVVISWAATVRRTVSAGGDYANPGLYKLEPLRVERLFVSPQIVHAVFMLRLLLLLCRLCVHCIAALTVLATLGWYLGLTSAAL